VFFEAEGWEMHARPEDLRLGKDANAAHSINIHFHVRIAIWVSQICKMWAPCSIFGVPLHNDGIFIKCICEAEGCFGFLPGVEIIRLFTSQPIR
jgi:hypothetical protein